jgi:predicted flap endonuclease-1-like 5' DNA nuclease
MVLTIAGALWKLRQVSDWCREKMQSFEEPMPLSPPAPRKPVIIKAKTPPLPPLQPDNLQRIKGIGPKMAQLLNKHNIYTFEQLAVANVDTLADLLRQRGWYMADPSTWIEQARKIQN